jgi:hypothetical protein
MNSGSVDADTATEVRHNVPRSRYEITVDGRVVGFAATQPPSSAPHPGGDGDRAIRRELFG